MDPATSNKRIVQLEAKVNQLEQTMWALIIRLGLNPEEFIARATPEIHQDIRIALQAGDKLKAVKLYREYYHVGLREAQDIIESMLHS